MPAPASKPRPATSALVEAAQRPADWVMAAISGATGLKPTLAAIERGATVALANKECLVCAGGLFMRRAAAAGATVLPVDSEHNAIFQALGAGDARTCGASSSPPPAVRSAPGRARRSRRRRRSRRCVIRTGRWARRSPIDSRDPDEQGPRTDRGASPVRPCRRTRSTCWCIRSRSCTAWSSFATASMVAQLGAPDMRIPIAHCLAWPERMSAPAPRLDLAKIGSLTFEEPDLDPFPGAAACPRRRWRRAARRRPC